MKKFVFIIVLCAFAALFAQDDRQRSMMKRTVFYASPDGKVGTSDYWQLALGNFEVEVERRFPGEGAVKVEGSVNIALMSGGYVEGNGFGNRGRLVANAELAVLRDGKYEFVRVEAIDFIFLGGSKIKLKESENIEDLYIHIEDPSNVSQARRFILSTYNLARNTGELTYDGEISPIIAISFTQEGARRGYQAALEH